MLEPELFLLFVRPLNALGIRYFVGGSVSAVFYGEPRFTLDIDLVVFLTAPDVLKLVGAFPGTEFYVPPLETIRTEMMREKNGHFNIIHNASGFRADVYLSGRDELNAWGFRLRRQLPFENESVTVAPPEYIIIRKLEYYREGGSEKHLRDIRSVLTVSESKLDLSAIKEWVQRLGLEAEWLKVSN